MYWSPPFHSYAFKGIKYKGSVTATDTDVIRDITIRFVIVSRLSSQTGHNWNSPFAHCLLASKLGIWPCRRQWSRIRCKGVSVRGGLPRRHFGTLGLRTAAIQTLSFRWRCVVFIVSLHSYYWLVLTLGECLMFAMFWSLVYINSILGWQITKLSTQYLFSNNGARKRLNFNISVFQIVLLKRRNI